MKTISNLQDADIALYAVDDVFEVGSLTYKVLSDDTVQVGDGDTAMTGLSGSVTIPSSVKYGEQHTRLQQSVTEHFSDVRILHLSKFPTL